MTWRKLWAYTLRGMQIEWSYKLTFFGRALSQLVHLAFVYYLAQVVGNGSDAMEGIYQGHYLEFLLIGSLFAQYLVTSLRELPVRVRQEVMMGTLEPILATPTRTSTVLLGSSLWPQVEATLLLGFSLMIGTRFLGADLSQAHWASAALVTLLGLLCLTAWGILSVAFVIVFKRADPINWAIGATALFFSGVYFPVQILPRWLRIFSYLFPLTYCLEMLRSALILGTPPLSLGRELAVLGALTALSLPTSLYVLDRALQRGRQSGSLTHY